MSTLEKKETVQETVEERFAHAGAKIDQLIADARAAKEALIEKEEHARKHSTAALEEIKRGLDKAWQELNHAWSEICKTGEHPVQTLPPTPEKTCCNKEHEA